MERKCIFFKPCFGKQHHTWQGVFCGRSGIMVKQLGAILRPANPLANPKGRNRNQVLV